MFRSLALVLLLGVSWALALPAVKTASEKTMGTCRPFNYCDGQLFDKERIVVEEFAITCNNTVTNTKDQCCLPGHQHKVCYDIKVEGGLLNLDPTDSSVSTDFSALCEAILETMDLKVGRHTVATIAEGGGTIIYRAGGFSQTSSGEKHMRDLACEYKDA